MSSDPRIERLWREAVKQHLRDMPPQQIRKLIEEIGDDEARATREETK